MPTVTIKTRLTLFFTVIVAVVLAVAMIVTYYNARYWRSEEFYSKLVSNAVATAAIILRSDNLSPRVLQPFRQQMLKTLPDECITIFNKQGKSVFHSGSRIVQITENEQKQAMMHQRYIVSEKDTSFGILSEYEHEQAVKNGKLAIAIGDTQKVIIPFLDENGNAPLSIFPAEKDTVIPVTGNIEYIVAISAVDLEGRKALQRLGTLLIFSYAISLLIVFTGGIIFAGQVLAPVSALRQKAERITATDLHIRIDEGKRNDELTQLAHAFNVMLDRLESAFTSQKQFISNASHELRTPLTAIAGQLDVLLMQPRTSDEYKNAISTVLDSMRQLNRLVNNLLLFARAESEQLKPLRIDDILFTALDKTKERYPGRTVDMQFLVSADQENSLVIFGNEDLLVAAIVNVIDNAFKYSDISSSVKITVAEPEKDKLRISVSDKGIGITSADMPMIFQPFFRSNRSSQFQGNGIGLALVKAIMDRHGGVVNVDSVEGKATVVTMSFPIFADTV